MLTKKKKLSRKEIKEDKLVATYYKVYNYFDENKQRILMYGGIAIAVVLVGYFYMSSRQSSNETAGLQLSRVINLYDQGSYLEAIEGKQGTNLVGLKKIVEEYGGTENGETAKIYLANAYFMLGKNEEAYKYYEDYGGDIDLYKAAAYAGQAGYFADKKEYDKAADLFMKAARVSEANAFNADYMLKAGINYIDAGKIDEAKDIFKTIKKDYATTLASRDVDRYLVTIQ